MGLARGEWALLSVGVTLLSAVLLLSGCGAVVPVGKFVDRPAMGSAASESGRTPVTPAAPHDRPPAPIIDASRFALLMPTAGFGQEENRQALARGFHDLLAELRPELKTTSLADTISAINGGEMAETYGRMYTAYKETGLYDRQGLQKLGEATGARYLIQLKLQSFNQNNRSRFGYVGINIVQTQTTGLRLFVQVWDSVEGRIVWEDSNETVRQVESIRERTVTLESVVKTNAEDLIRRLPRTTETASRPAEAAG